MTRDRRGQRAYQPVEEMWYAGLSAREIAALLGASLGWVYAQLRRVGIAARDGYPTRAYHWAWYARTVTGKETS